MPNYKEYTFAELFDGAKADYNAAKVTAYRRRRTGLPLTGGGADWHYRHESDWLRMMEWARDFDRNDLVTGQATNRLCNNVYGEGPKLNPDTGDEELDGRLRDKWAEWSTNPRKCHLGETLDFDAIAELTLRQTVVDGDCFTLPIAETGSLETHEAHRCRTPRNTSKNVVHGILLDDNRKPLEYWFTKDPINPSQQLVKVSDTIPVSARDQFGDLAVLHHFRRRRFSQTRGVTAYAPIFDAIGIHDDIQFAQLLKAQLCASYAIIENRPVNPPSIPKDGDGQTGERTEETLEDGSTRMREGIAPAMRIRGKPGSQLEGFSPNIPNPEFFKHAMMILQFIAVNLDLPVQVLLLDPSQTNFSGWRGAIDQARRTFRAIIRWLIKSLHIPVYVWKVKQWLDQSDDEKLRELAKKVAQEHGESRLYKHTWMPPAFPYIQPVEDVTADTIRAAKGHASIRRILAERGLDFEEEMKHAVEDRKRIVILAMQAVQEITQQFPDQEPPDWRELAPLPSMDGLKLSLKLGGGGDAGDTDSGSGGNTNSRGEEDD